MKTKTLFSLFCGLLVACTAAPALKPAPDPVQEPFPLIALRPAPDAANALNDLGEIDALLAYHQRLRELAPAELAKELAALHAQPKSAQVALKKSMLLTLSHNDGDLARAQTLVDGVVKSAEPDALAVKPLGQILAIHYTEMRRLSDQADRLNQQAKESQRRIEQLNGTLEALKAIERTLPARPNGAPAASVSKGSP